jgi:hypothetical protein
MLYSDTVDSSPTTGQRDVGRKIEGVPWKRRIAVWEGPTRCNADIGRYRKQENPFTPECLRARSFGRDLSSRTALWPAAHSAAPTEKQNIKNPLPTGSRSHMTQMRPPLNGKFGPPESGRRPSGDIALRGLRLTVERCCHNRNTGREQLCDEKRQPLHRQSLPLSAGLS